MSWIASAPVQRILPTPAIGGKVHSERVGLNGLAEEIHENSVRHDWWAPRIVATTTGEVASVPRELPEILMLIDTETAEAMEEWRDGHAPDQIYYTHEDGQACVIEDCPDTKPEGVPIELADVLIRVLDACVWLGIDIERALRIKMDYNRTRSINHGRVR
jgi:NTP pyrophosphatase (non-canonical NTP hydrolase)